MTFELPKISASEYGFFSKGTQAPSINKPTFTSGQVHTGSKAGGLQKDLNEIAQFGAKKADNSESLGLGGASTPCEGTGKKLWTYC